LYVEKGLGRLQFAVVVAHLALVLAQVQSAIEELVGGGLLLIPGEDFLALWEE